MKTIAIVLLIACGTFAAAKNDIIEALKKDNQAEAEAEAIKLIESGVDANEIDDNQQSPMHIASEFGYFKVVKLLIDKGYKNQVTNINKWKNTPLHRASEYGRENIVDLLIENGANVSASSQDGWTPLHNAANNGHLSILKKLIEKGADVNVKKDDGYIALHNAAQKGHHDVVKFLAENGADVNAISNSKWTPINLAAWKKSENDVKLLIDSGGDVNIPNNELWSPLHNSAYSGHNEIVKLLLSAGADINAKTNKGNTPKDIAKEQNKQKTVDILVAAARKLNRTKINKNIEDICESYRADKPSDYIFDARPAIPNEFPWMAALGYFNIATNAIDYRCGGTIISEQFILTAAHCTDTEQPPVVVRLGTIFLTDYRDAKNYYIQRIIQHDEYSNQAKKNDIALLRLQKSIQITADLRPACLETDAHDKNSNLRLKVTGWGITNSGSYTVSDRLLNAEVNTIPLAECNATYVNHNKKINHPAFRDGIFEGQYCAYDPERKTNACQGDSGGPLQMIDDTKTAHVVGIVSFGLGCGNNFPGIYTRVAHYSDWIASHVWPDAL